MTITTESEEKQLCFQSCSFCVAEKLESDLYRCPKCKKYYCSLRCYRNKKHLQCSEKFYEKQCREAMGEKIDGETTNNVKPPTTMTFDEYMDSKREEQSKLTETDVNPQIPIGEDEEILFDSDDEPEYLQNIVDSTLKQFKKADTSDLDRELLAAGLPMELSSDTSELSQEQMEQIYQRLSEEEKRTFTRLADDMFSEEMGFNANCFRNKKGK